MEENRQIMRALATAMNRIDQMYCDDVTRIGVKASELWLLYALDDGAPHSQKQICQEWGLPKTTLNTTIRNNRFFNNINTLVDSHQTLVSDRSDRTSCVTSNSFCTFYITFIQSIFDTFQQFAGVSFSQVQVNDSFQAESQTENQCDGNQTHEVGTTFDKLSLQSLVHATFNSGFGSFLRECYRRDSKST